MNDDDEYPVGSSMDCWRCWHDEHPDVEVMDGTEVPPKRQCVRLGPVVGRADPTQTYVLACGHTTI